MTRYGFHFDAASCSGCKACQVACKDRNDLPLGVRWRRVYEVVGGGWERRGDAWVNDVVAWNLSMACNHCERPICVDVCPAGALRQREDGLVLLDGGRCLGCRYCEWACPYGAPQYDPAAGRMTKCTFCVDDVDAGGAPACVAACGLRALDFGDLEELEARHGPAATLAPSSRPLPDPALTAPALSMRHHDDADRADSAGVPVRVGNREEVGQVGSAGPGQGSLVAFTVVAQLAVGVAWAALVASLVGLDAAAGPGAAPAHTVGWLFAGAAALMAGAAASSLAHLGSPMSAWRATSNLRTSWLSREVALVGLFAAAAAAVAWTAWAGRGGPGLRAGAGLVPAALGAALLLAMGRVYRLPTVPGWETRLTPASFFLTAASLGGFAGALALVLLEGSVSTAARPGALPATLLLLVAVSSASVSVELWLEPLWGAHRRRTRAAAPAGLHARATLLITALAAAAAAWAFVLARAAGDPLPRAVLPATLATALLAATAASVVGRAAFYRSHVGAGLSRPPGPDRSAGRRAGARRG